MLLNLAGTVLLRPGEVAEALALVRLACLSQGSACELQFACVGSGLDQTGPVSGG